ncbi:triosephosphate isomerase [Platysternon megacephalum]|uniref:Triosephosphate isomerase n=1 Tax=Platysternon megacephalum TaxID=55544 RepID=A0A4D9DCN5_9SAUR|nr:triosephosphate isomerase [Platysternon megacephalum]
MTLVYPRAITVQDTALKGKQLTRKRFTQKPRLWRRSNARSSCPGLERNLLLVGRKIFIIIATARHKLIKMSHYLELNTLVLTKSTHMSLECIMATIEHTHVQRSQTQHLRTIYDGSLRHIQNVLTNCHIAGSRATLRGDMAAGVPSSWHLCAYSKKAC